MYWSFTAFLTATKPSLQAQDISHGLSCFFLCRCCHMGIGVQGEACGKVTQHVGHGLDVHTILQGNGCEGVAEIVESDLRDTIVGNCDSTLFLGGKEKSTLKEISELLGKETIDSVRPERALSKVVYRNNTKLIRGTISLHGMRKAPTVSDRRFV